MIHDATHGFLAMGAPFTDLALTQEYQFYLTGSHFFGYATPQSDWDFIAQDTPATQAFLKQLGFTSLKSPKYLTKFDPSRPFNITTDIWQWLHGTTKVQVQFTTDVARKRACRDIIHAHPLLVRGHAQLKSTGRSRIWDALAEVLALAEKAA